MTTLIERPEDLSKFAIIRPEYVKMLGSRPAAMLLSVVEAWTDWLRKRGKSIFVRLSGNAISNAVSGLFCRKTFMRAGKLLEELGLIARVQKSSSDRTYQYLLQTQAVQNRLNLLVWWNTLRTYSQLIRFANTGNWFNFGKQWLETLLGNNGTSVTFQGDIETSCIKNCNSTLKQDIKAIEKNTTTHENVVAFSNESEYQEVIEPHPVCLEPPIKQVKSKLTQETNQALISEERIKLVEDAGIKLNATLCKAVMEYTLTEVQSAIAHYRQVVKDSGERDRPGGWLTDCLKGKWWKNDLAAVSSTEKELFTQWRKSSPKYKWINSCSDISATGLELGQIGVLVGDEWINWRKLQENKL